MIKFNEIEMKKVCMKTYLLLLICLLFFFTNSCVKKSTEPDVLPPIIITSELSKITTATAQCGGNVTTDGGAPVTERGVCWSTTQNPTLASYHTSDSIGTGSFISMITGLLVNTSYYVRAYATNLVGTCYGEQKHFTTVQYSVAQITTLSVNTTTLYSAKSGGFIINDGGCAVTARGVCWDISQNPTLASSHTNDGANNGNFISSITGLLANTSYFVRAYATNCKGTSYGNNISFISMDSNLICGTVLDIDGNTYNTTIIGSQCWMRENLKVTKYRDGTSIPNVPGNSYSYNDWSDLYTDAYTDYENSISNSIIYGRLYNWYAVTNSHNICPNGWHVPSDAEWTILENYLIANAYNYDNTTTGNKCAKSLASAIGWCIVSGIPTTGAVWTSDFPEKKNITGFTALPGGYLVVNYYDKGCGGYWWSTTEYNYSFVWERHLLNDRVDLIRSPISKNNGLSVRCIRD